MNSHIARWRTEHANFNRMLTLVDNEIATFRGGERPDYELLLDVLHYMTNGPDRTHHPFEDRACERLVERKPETSAAVRALAEEHRHIASTGSRLVENLGAAVDGAVLPRSVIEDDAADYATYLRNHMRQEEESIFPLLDRSLEDDDWAWVDREATQADDPLFGANASQRYKALQRRIAEQAGCDCDLGD
jgi:hemerythrin-like domain-containing protein